MKSKQELIDQAVACAARNELFVWAGSTPRGCGVTVVIYGEHPDLADFVNEFGGWLTRKPRGARQGDTAWKIIDDQAERFLTELIPNITGDLIKHKFATSCLNYWVQNKHVNAN